MADAPDEGSPEEEATESPEEEASEYPEFTIPEGLDLSDLGEGDQKEVLCVIKKNSDDTACIVSVDGVALAGGETAPPEEEEAPPEEMPAGPPPAAMPAGPAGAGIRSRAMGAGLM